MDYRGIVSGDDKSMTARLLRGLLLSGELLYSSAMAVRNFSYDFCPWLSVKVRIPVISIGNLTMGGTGKTPLTALVGQHFISKGLSTAIISRGYHSKPGQLNDEGKEILRRIPECTYIQNPRRVQAAKKLTELKESAIVGESAEIQPIQVIVLDDGFQHRQLRRELDIVLLDAVNPFGYGHVCPRGFLRESISGLTRAQVVVITHADMVDAAVCDSIRTTILSINPQLTVCLTRHRPGALQRLDGSSIPISEVVGKRVTAFCGLGNPAAFGKTVESLGCKVAQFDIFGDHHIYTREDEFGLIEKAKANQADAILCTMKDFVKLSDLFKESDIPLYGVQIDMVFISSEAEFWQVVDRAAEKKL